MHVILKEVMYLAMHFCAIVTNHTKPKCLNTINLVLVRKDPQRTSNRVKLAIRIWSHRMSMLGKLDLGAQGPLRSLVGSI